MSIALRGTGFGISAGGGSGGSGPGDQGTVLIAVSVRKVVDAYAGDCLRVRRSSDNAEQDIGFDGNGDLDTTALTTFVGAGDGFVRWLYDQSGNGHDVGHSAAAQQPKIVSAGSVIVDGDGNPVVRFDGSSDMIRATGMSGLALTDLEFMCVAEVQDKTNDFARLATLDLSSASDFNNADAIVLGANDADNTKWFATRQVGSDHFNPTAIAHPSGQGLYQTRLDGAGTGYIRSNDDAEQSDTYDDLTNIDPTTFRLGAGIVGGSVTEFMQVDISEALLWSAELSAGERSSVRSDINTYYTLW